LATIDAQSIIIRGSDSDILTGADMYNRDRLEQAVVKALVNPAETPRETGTTYQSVGPS
jgi:hypothetical protein